jgi:uncharacterized iron-regulated protein
MYRIAALNAAVIAVCLSGCAAVPPTASTTAATAGSAIVPLANFYDVAWVRSADGSARTLEQVADELSAFDVVFFGEYHSHSGNHLAQMRLFQALQERYADMSLSLEQFERDTQPLVDQYLAGEIGEKVLEKDARAWPNYKESYRPLVEYAVRHQLPVIAANAPKNIVICVGKKGAEILDEIPEPDRGWAAAELHLDEGAYLDKYMSVMGGSSHARGPGDEAESELSPMMRAMVMRSFAAQVTRDDTMAESIALHLRDNPHRKVLHLNGNFHSASHLGTVERLKMRMPGLKIAVINPVAVEDNDAPAWAADDAGTGDYLLLVQSPPVPFVSEEKELEFQREIMSKRAGNKCEYAEESAPEHEMGDAK